MKTVTDNPFQQAQTPHQWTFKLQKPQTAAVELAYEDLAWSLATFEHNDAEFPWVTRAIFDHSDLPEARQRLWLLQQQDAMLLNPDELLLDDTDWVSQVQEQFIPIHAGRFYIHGSHITSPPPVHSIPLLVDAGAAFGTGEHATTRACLLAIDQMLKRRSIACALDVGCGSAILAMAIAKATRRRHYGIEIDPMSVAVAQSNVRQNQLAKDCIIREGNGCQAPDMPGRYDLIVANILARPLMELSHRFRQHLMIGGELILSGLLVSQEEMVLWAYRQHGITLKHRIRLEGWSALVLQG